MKKTGLIKHTKDNVVKGLSYASFLKAIQRDDVVSLRKLVKHCTVWLHQFDEQGDSAVITAVRYRANGALEVLLQQGASVNNFGYDKQTALHWAIQQGEMEVVEKLLSYQASLDSVNNQGCTPKQWAIKQNQPKIECLLNQIEAHNYYAEQLSLQNAIVKLTQEEDIISQTKATIINDANQLNALASSLLALQQALQLPESLLQYDDYFWYQCQKTASSPKISREKGAYPEKSPKSVERPATTAISQSDP